MGAFTHDSMVKFSQIVQRFPAVNFIQPAKTAISNGASIKIMVIGTSDHKGEIFMGSYSILILFLIAISTFNLHLFPLYSHHTT